MADRADLDRLAKEIIAKPQATLAIDLESQSVRMGGIDVPATMPEGARQSLVSGNWDFLGQLLEGATAVKQATSRIPYLAGFHA